MNGPWNEDAAITCNAGLSTADSSGGGNQTCSSTLVLFSMYTLEILGRGNQPQGWGNPCAPPPSKYVYKSLLKGVWVREIPMYAHLSEHGFIHFIVAMPPIADQVNDHVLVEGLSPLCSHLTHMHHSLRVIGIHMEDGSRYHLCDMVSVLFVCTCTCTCIFWFHQGVY